MVIVNLYHECSQFSHWKKSNDFIILFLRECAARNSPMKIVQSRGLTIKCKVLVTIAERDSPAFHTQSKDFYNLLKEKLLHHSVEYLEVPEVDHFSFIEKCVEKDYTLNKVLAKRRIQVRSKVIGHL